MSKFAKSLVLVIILTTVAVLVAGCSTGFVPQGKQGANPSSSISSFSRPTNGLVQTSVGEAVTIDVEWVPVNDAPLLFEVAMNTHSVDLDQYDLGTLALLRDDTGNEYPPVSWDSAAGGHHRSGTLTFPVPDSVSQGKTKYIEMIIRDVAGIEERVFKWEL